MSSELVSAIAGFVIAMVLWWLNSRSELARTRLLIAAQAAQTRLELDAQTEQARYPDLARTVGEFAAEMRRLDRVHTGHVMHSGERLVDDWSNKNGEDPPREEADAELGALTLEFFADDAMVSAARAWLEEFYVVWHDKEPKGFDARRTQFDALHAAEKRYVAEARRSLKVAASALT